MDLEPFHIAWSFSVFARIATIREGWFDLCIRPVFRVQITFRHWRRYET
jgi:hypothetical protein